MVGFSGCISFIKGKGLFKECFKELSALLAVRHLDIALPSVLTTRYCIPQDWQTVLHQICSTKNPFDLRCESVTLIE